VYQWYQTVTGKGVSQVIFSAALLNTSNWQDAFQVLFYAIMLDKFTMALLLAFVWFGLPESRQRSVLFIWAVLQGIMYQYRFNKHYAEGDFANLKSVKHVALACSVVSGLAWLAPTLPLSSVANNDNNANTNNNKQKTR
jgi:hypothetical protein